MKIAWVRIKVANKQAGGGITVKLIDIRLDITILIVCFLGSGPFK